jgi:hypothetical protein
LSTDSGHVRTDKRVPDNAQKGIDASFVGRKTICDLWAVGIN